MKESRVFDLLCIRSYDFVMWWFDLDFILFDFVFDFILCVTFIFIFIIGFFIRIIFSFVFVILFIINIVKIMLTVVYSSLIFIYIDILFKFVCFFFCFSLTCILRFCETLCIVFIFVFFDFISFSLFTIGLTNWDSIQICGFCTFLFILFYFIIKFNYSFLFFIIRCLFVIISDFLYLQFDLHVGIYQIDYFRFDFMMFALYFNSVLLCFGTSFFHFLVVLNQSFLLLFSVIILFFSFQFNILPVNIFCKTHFVAIFCYFRNITSNYLSIIKFFKFIFNDLFFLFFFILLVFIVSFFGFFVKDFVFLSIFYDMMIVQGVIISTFPIHTFYLYLHYVTLLHTLYI